jgi:hypothetical protein
LEYKAGTIIDASLYQPGAVRKHPYERIDFAQAGGHVGALVQHFVRDNGKSHFKIEYLDPKDALDFVRQPLALRARFGHNPVDVEATKLKLTHLR